MCFTFRPLRKTLISVCLLSFAYLCKSKCSCDASCSVCCAVCVREFSLKSCFSNSAATRTLIYLCFVFHHGILEIPQALRQRYGDDIIPEYYVMFISFKGPVAQWIRHRPTEPGIAGSSPAGVIFVLLKPWALVEIQTRDSYCIRIGRVSAA